MLVMRLISIGAPLVVSSPSRCSERPLPFTSVSLNPAASFFGRDAGQRRLPQERLFFKSFVFRNFLVEIVHQERQNG